MTACGWPCGFLPQSRTKPRFAGRDICGKTGIPLEIHAYTDDSADAILTIFEQVAQQYDLRPLRWSIAHLNTGSPQTLERMRKLGLAYTVQMGPYFEGLAIRDANPPGATDNSPPVRLALDKGLVVAGGTDSTRIGIAGVWHAIEYHITGIASGGSVRKPASERLTRLEALALYTRHAAGSPLPNNTGASLASENRPIWRYSISHL